MHTAPRRGHVRLALVIIALSGASLAGCSRFDHERALVHQDTVTLRADPVALASVDK